MKNVLIISYSNFPNGDAGAIRQETFAKLLNNIGYNVVIVAMGKDNDNIYEIKKYNEISYASIRINSKGKIAKIQNYFGFKKRLKKFLKDTNIKFETMLVVDIPMNAWRFIKKYAKKNNVKVLHDCVEWYSPEQFKNRKFSYSYLKKNYINTKFISKDINVISISSFLNNYFSNKGINSVRIPVILDMEKNKLLYPKENMEKRHYMYAGSPGKKDNLDIMLKGIALMENTDINKIKIILYGVNEADIIKLISEEEYNKIKGSVKCFGKVSRNEILKAYTNASYTLLIRNDKLRYSKAGFPTKVVESLAYQTPVITNLTSDLGKYLKNMKNSIVVREFSPESFKEAIEKSIYIDDNELTKMQKKARETAEEKFDYKKYEGILRKLIKKGK